MAFAGIPVSPGIGPNVTFVEMGDGTKAQAVVPVIGTDPQGPANPAPTTDATTQGKLDSVVSALVNLLTELNGKTEPADTQQVSAASLPLPEGAATDASLASILAALTSQDAPASVRDSDAVWLLRQMSNVLRNFSFTSSSELRAAVSGSLTTLTTLTTGNIGFGDAGKASTAQTTSRQSFACGPGRNLIRS